MRSAVSHQSGMETMAKCCLCPVPVLQRAAQKQTLTLTFLFEVSSVSSVFCFTWCSNYSLMKMPFSPDLSYETTFWGLSLMCTQQQLSLTLFSEKNILPSCISFFFFTVKLCCFFILYIFCFCYVFLFFWKDRRTVWTSEHKKYLQTVTADLKPTNCQNFIFSNFRMTIYQMFYQSVIALLQIGSRLQTASLCFISNWCKTTPHALETHSKH